MQVAELSPVAVLGAGAALGAIFGLLGGRLADVLPGRYGITHLVTGPRRTRRNVALVVLSIAVAVGIAAILAGTGDLGIGHAAGLLVINAGAGAAVLAAAAIDLEHMILPNELTLGAGLVCLLTSPVRSIGITGSISGAVVGLLVSYVPFLVYKKIRGQSGMGLGDAKLSVMAGAWHGAEGAILVLFAGALQSAVVAVVMRLTGLRYDVPESVKAEIAELRALAAAGDAEAKSALADDPMAGEARDDTLGMRLPLGPFLALACIEVLFLRRWLVGNVLGWLAN